MPLTEFLRMVNKANFDAAPSKASTSDDPSCSRPDTDCAELVWENGQLTTIQHGESSKATHTTPKQDDDSSTITMGNGSKTTKSSTMDSMLDDFPISVPVPSCEMGLDHDVVDMVSWLNYPVQDPLHNDHYTPDFLRELSGVTLGDPPQEHTLGSREKRSSFSSSLVNLKHGFSSKAAPEKHQFFLPVEQKDVSKSGSSGVTVTNPSLSSFGFNNTRLQKMDEGQPSTSASGFTNLSYYYRPTTAISRTHSLTANNSVRLESDNDDKRRALRRSASLATNSAGVNVEESLPAKRTTEQLQRCSNQAACQVDVTTTKNGLEDQGHRGKAVTKAGMGGGEKNKDPVVATSSVCSGNSVERTSNDHRRECLKRKAREHGESDGQSDDADEESMGARKGASSGTGGKRSRAAEVHNQSERRRRDRINEKMRALQELVPNCNKVDKASMLDEAIEYLKTLQLQVQMLSMGSGMYMQPTMMVPTPAPPGMHPIHGPHFSGLGMGFGMTNMLDPTTGIKLMPTFQGPPQFPVMGPPAGYRHHHMMPTFQGPLKMPLAPLNKAPSSSGNPKDVPQSTIPSTSTNRATREN